MYIEEKKLIFIHIPKNAGISVEYILGNIYYKYINKNFYFMCCQKIPTFFKYLFFYVFIIRIIINLLFLISFNKTVLDNFSIGFIDNTLSIHLSALQYKNFLRDDYDNNIKFTIIRNPYTRMVSLYNYITPRIFQTKNNFIEFLLDIKNNKLNNNFFNSQYSYVVDKYGNNIINEYIRFENLENDWYLFCKKYNIPFKKLPMLNSKNKKQNLNLLDDYTKKLIYDIYKIDFIYFNYSYI